VFLLLGGLALGLFLRLSLSLGLLPGGELFLDYGSDEVLGFRFALGLSLLLLAQCLTSIPVSFDRSLISYSLSFDALTSSLNSASTSRSSASRWRWNLAGSE